MSRAVLVLGLLALCSIIAVTSGSPTLSDDTASLLESGSTRSSVSASVLDEAKKYAETKVHNAIDRSEALLKAAAEAGRQEAIRAAAASSSPSAPSKSALKAELKAELKATEKAVRDGVISQAKGEKLTMKAVKRVEKKLAAAKKAPTELEKAKALELAAKQKVAALKAERAAKRRALGFSGAGLNRNKDGVYGAVAFGVPKADSVPVPLKAGPKRSALERFKKFGSKKNIYGRHKSCLKDIAAHFDERDIYESKKLALLQKMSTTRSLAHAQSLRSKLQNLETWHQMMQKKFLMSATEQKVHQRRVEKLFHEHLPEELKNQLAQNKVAKRAAKPIPFPDAQKQAYKILRSKRKEIEKMDRMKQHGHKRMIRPEIDDKEFPSMDPISTLIREKLWRNIPTQHEWSTDRAEFERAENIVTAAHKAHGDFVEGPIAAPMLKGKLYHPKTEKLGVPNFLTKFPWPTEPEEKITMDDKHRVEQTYHQTW